MTLSSNPFELLGKAEESAASASGAGSENLGVHQKELHKRHGQKPRRGSRGGWHGHGRQFDRHSGALPDSERKIKKGWMGNSEESIESPVEDTEENGVVDTENETKEESLKTLDEYLAEKASLKPSTKMQPGRKPNEGSEDKWKNAVPLEKKEEFVLPVGNKDEKASKPKKNKETKTKQTLDIEQRFNTEASGFRRGQSRGQSRGASRGNSRGRGRGVGGRGGRGRGGRGPAINLKDSSAFPLLA